MAEQSRLEEMQQRLTRVLLPGVRSVKRLSVTDREDAQETGEYVRELIESVLADERIAPLLEEDPKIKSLLLSVYETADDFTGRDDALPTKKQIREFKKEVLPKLLEAMGMGDRVDSRALALAAKDPFPQLPEDVVGAIGSVLSGQEGPLGVQRSKLRVKYGKPGVPSNGGRKTKKNRSSNKKTHGRRV